MPTRTMACWIQRADFTSTDPGAVDARGAVELMRAHDWAGEWRLLEERQAGGLDACPPGAGFVNGAGGLLHVCPDRSGRALASCLVHYHFRERRRWLGLVSYDELIVRTNAAVVPSQLPEFIRRFYEDDHAWLVNETEAASGEAPDPPVP